MQVLRPARALQGVEQAVKVPKPPGSWIVVVPSVASMRPRYPTPPPTAIATPDRHVHSHPTFAKAPDALAWAPSSDIVA